MSEEPLSHDSDARFRAAKWRMLFVTMFLYLFYYTGRLNWGWAIAGIKADLGLTDVQAGIIAGAMLAAYGAGQFVNGNLGDKFGGRLMMSLGAVLSCVLNWVTSFGRSFVGLLIPWAANGCVQSLGWAPGSRLLSNWWGHKERGKAFGFYVAAAGCATVLAFALSILVLKMHWRWVFRLPVLLLFLGGVVYYLVARNKPEDLGLKPLTDESADVVQAEEGETTLQRYLHVLSNWRFLVACAAIGCESAARWGLLTWVPMYYLGKDWKKDPSGGWITLAMCFGMVLGALAAGQISDRLFGSKRSKPIALFMSLGAIVSLWLCFLPRGEGVPVTCLLLFAAGFLVYGPQSSFWALCPDLLGRKRAGTAVGVMDAAAYGCAAVAQPLLGLVIHHYSGAGLFVATALACVAGSVLILIVKR